MGAEARPVIRGARRGVAPLAFVVAIVGASCSDRTARPPAPARRAVATPPPPTIVVDASAPLDGAAAQDAAAAEAAITDARPKYPGRTDGCPNGMVRVEGEYCLAAEQLCIEKTITGDPTHIAERCLKYREPSRCVVPRTVHKSFCIDRFEYPNTEGELPRVLTSWGQALEMCNAQGKRLCNDDEYNFACEGPNMLPYVYGYVRDANACNIDKPYRNPDMTFRLGYYDQCLADAKCAAELARLDQRHRIGQVLSCVSWAGVYDLNGNVNEWVRLPNKQKYPDRSGLKGGWWGPVRGRCRALVTFHKEDDYGYEVGFRCCKDTDKKTD